MYSLNKSHMFFIIWYFNNFNKKSGYTVVNLFFKFYSQIWYHVYSEVFDGGAINNFNEVEKSSMDLFLN